jgi:hypothetical protein
VNEYLQKDSEQTMQLNTSMGNLGAGILDSFVTNRDSDANARFKAIESCVDESTTEALEALDAVATVELVPETRVRQITASRLLPP